MSPRRSRFAGTASSKYVPSPDQLMEQGFVAVDFETANRRGGASACQVALVKVSQGQIVDRYVSMLKPPAGYDRFDFTYLHGIGKEHVQDAPSWPDVICDVLGLIDGLPVYAHNASFDARIWRELDDHFATTTYPDPFFCSYRTAQRLLPGLENYRLPTVVKACAPEYSLDHHKADSDAEACALIIASLQQRAVSGMK